VEAAHARQLIAVAVQTNGFISCALGLVSPPILHEHNLFARQLSQQGMIRRPAPDLGVQPRGIRMNVTCFRRIARDCAQTTDTHTRLRVWCHNSTVSVLTVAATCGIGFVVVQSRRDDRSATRRASLNVANCPQVVCTGRYVGRHPSRAQIPVCHKSSVNVRTTHFHSAEKPSFDSPQKKKVGWDYFFFF
jgi:hypothetical protein